MQVFNIASPSGRPFWILVPAFVVIAAALAVLVLVTVSGRSARFEVSSEGVRLRGDLWGRLVPAASLRVDQARRLDFTTSPELLPGRRTMGTGLPGYQAGWFRLKNGDKALLYLTDRSKAIYIPTTEDYALILSPDDPDGFMAALKDLSGGR
jgi:hypothetical protein